MEGGCTPVSLSVTGRGLNPLYPEINVRNTPTLQVGCYFLRFLTLYPNIMIVFFYQLDAQILYFNTFITFLYMFRALLCSSSGGQIVLVQHLISSLFLGDCSVLKLRASSRNLCTEQSPKERLRESSRNLCTKQSPKERLGESSRNLCTEQSPKDSDDTRCCVNTIDLLKMSIIVLKTCRGI